MSYPSSNTIGHTDTKSKFLWFFLFNIAIYICSALYLNQIKINTISLKTQCKLDVTGTLKIIHDILNSQNNTSYLNMWIIIKNWKSISFKRLYSYLMKIFNYFTNYFDIANLDNYCITDNNLFYIAFIINFLCMWSAINLK